MARCSVERIVSYSHHILERVHDHCLKLDGGDESAREPLVRELLDTFGTGRVMFRNTREALTGFPERKASLIPLSMAMSIDCHIEARLQWLDEAAQGS